MALKDRREVLQALIPGAGHVQFSEALPGAGAMTTKFPFAEDTLGKKLEAGTGLSVDCLTEGCA